MDHQRFVTKAFTISESQNEWLIEQANKRLLSKSAIVREALLKLRKVKDGNKKSPKQ